MPFVRTNIETAKQPCCIQTEVHRLYWKIIVSIHFSVCVIYTFLFGYNILGSHCKPCYTQKICYKWTVICKGSCVHVHVFNRQINPLYPEFFEWTFPSLYPRHTKYVGVYSFRFSVCTYICSYVCLFVHLFVRSFVFPSQGQSFWVKVYKTSYFLKTLWWISFIFGMMVDIGLRFLSAPSPPLGWPWGQGHGLRIFIKKSKFFVFKFI